MGECRGTKALEVWCRRLTEGYPGVKIENMTTSWRDGLAFCAIIHHFRPDLIEFSKLNKDDIYHNNELAFRVAEHHLGIPALLEPEDMVECTKPDRLSILTYLSQFYQVFQGSSATTRIPAKRPQSTTDHGIVSPASSSPPTKVPFHGTGKIRREPCAKCGLPVFLAERLNVGKQLFHRTCFRCARCESQLTLDNYYETENGDFCCETCPDEETSIMDSPVRSVLSHSMSDEEKSALSKKLITAEDEYETMFETALEHPKDDSLKRNFSLTTEQSAEFTRARSQFFHSQIECDSGQDEPPDLPKLPPPSSNENSDISFDSGFPINNSVNTISNSVSLVSKLDEENNVTKDDTSSSLVKSRMQIFESLEASSIDVPSVTDFNKLDKQREDNILTEYEKLKPEKKCLNLDNSVLSIDDSTRIEISSPSSDYISHIDSEDEERNVVIFNEEKSLDIECSEENLLEKSDIVDEEKLDNVDIEKSDNNEEALETSADEEKIINVDCNEEKSDLTTEKTVPSSNENKSLEDSQLTGENEISKNNVPDIILEEFENGEVTEKKIEPEEVEEKEVPEVPPVVPKPRQRKSQKTLQKMESYPDDLNPFGDNEEEINNSLNPFGDDSDEEPTPNNSMNPFGDDSDEEIPSKPIPSPRVRRKIPFDEDSQVKLPVPKPRETLRQSDQKRTGSVLSATTGNYGSNNSLSSSTSGNTLRKKNPAPKPPTPFKNGAQESGHSSLTSSPSQSLSHSPRLTPKVRKSKRAPAPPVASTPHSRLETDNEIICAKNISDESLEPEKSAKDEQNRNRQSLNFNIQSPSSSENSSSLNSAPNKSTYGKWKRRKHQAPNRPIPQRRNIKPLPMGEIKRELGIIEIQLQGLEKQGVMIEQIIRDKSENNPNQDETLTVEVEDMILQLFEVVNEKNELFRKQTELMYLRRMQRLEEEHADIEYQIRCLMLQPDANKTDADKVREDELINRLVDIVERRNEIIECLEMDRLREAQEDDSINNHLNLYTLKREECVKENSAEKQKKEKKKHRISKEKIKQKLHMLTDKDKHKKVDMDKDVDEAEQPTDKEKKKKKKFNLF